MNTPRSNPIHLFRAILREATYLPDATARTFHAKHVAASFRKHRFDIEKKDGGTLPSKQETYYMRRGRKYLYMLQRANQGYIKNLENVLKLAYARKGKRRREMMGELLARGSTGVESSPNPPEQWRPSQEFTILLRKQNKIQSYFDRRSVKPMPKIPALNRFNKPFPKSRAKNLVERWYARHTQLIQPPLTEAEWLSVYRQTTDQSDSLDKLVPKRRTLACVPVFALQEHDLSNLQSELEMIGCTSAQKGPVQQSRRVRTLIGSPHKFTRRFLRRILQRSVLQATPTLEVDAETGKFGPRWDLGREPQRQPQTATTSQSLSMFY